MSAPRRQRLDAELVRRGLARSRAHAGELVAAGRVTVSGSPAAKPATQVESAAPIEVIRDAALPLPGVVREGAGARVDGPEEAAGSGLVTPWASRGSHKLLGALDAFVVPVAGRRALDAGASTGGFTDVLLRAGAASVVAVDVGYGQLRWHLRTDPRVQVLDRTNVRSLRLEDVAPAPSVVVADLSFISLRLVLPALSTVAGVDADFLLMVKPQFEVGRERLGAGGVVRDPALRELAVIGVLGAAADQGLCCHGVVASPLPGPSGNVEYFVHLRHGELAERPTPDTGRHPAVSDDVAALVRDAVAAGPDGARVR